MKVELNVQIKKTLSFLIIYFFLLFIFFFFVFSFILFFIYSKQLPGQNRVLTVTLFIGLPLSFIVVEWAHGPLWCLIWCMSRVSLWTKDLVDRIVLGRLSPILLGRFIQLCNCVLVSVISLPYSTEIMLS